jgi:type IV pilus assembly protein PilN
MTEGLTALERTHFHLLIGSEGNFMDKSPENISNNPSGGVPPAQSPVSGNITTTQNNAASKAETPMPVNGQASKAGHQNIDKVSSDISEDNQAAKTTEEKKTFFQKLNSKLKENFCTEAEVIGVEIQPDTIRVCEATRNKEGLWQITKLASKSVLNTYNYDSLGKNKDLYSKALSELLKKNKISSTNIALSLPASVTIIKTISLPLMTPENLQRATKIKSFWQNLVQLSDNLEDYSIFYRIIKEYPEKKEMDILFVATKYEDLNLFKEIASNAGLRTIVVDVGCFSVNNLSKLKQDKTQKTEVFLKVGRDENYLQILEEGKPSIYDIFIPENEKSYLNEYLDHQTFQQRFSSQLNHIISKYEEKTKHKVDNINIFSTEKNIDNFLNELNNSMPEIAIKKADFFEEIQVSKQINELEEFKDNKTSWAVSVGLATRQIDIFSDDSTKDISETVNLIPEADIVKADLKSKFYSKIIVWAAAIISLLFISHMVRFHMVSIKGTLSKLQNSMS